MHIKKFRGGTLEEVLRGVKKTFGEDAVILSTKRGKGCVEVMAAVDFDVEEIEHKLTDDVLTSGMNGLRREITELKSLFSTIVKEAAVREISSLGAGALSLYRWMLSNGIDEKLAQEIVRKAAAVSSGNGDIKKRCYNLLLEKTAVSNPLSGGDRPKLLALMGPTGTGKTTTIAKLAGVLTQKFKTKVGVVSIDDTKPGGNEALKLWGQRFGFSFSIPKTAKDLNRSLWGIRDRDIILIDTPGKNPKNDDSIAELSRVLNSGLPIRAALVLSVTSRDEALYDACRGFCKLPIDCLVFTKIDEARHFGSILNTVALTKKPVAYLCNGRGIPSDIGVASHKVLVDLFARKGWAHG